MVSTIDYDELFPSVNAIEIQDHYSESNKVVDYSFSQVRQSHQNKWDELVISALSVAAEVNPYLSDVPDGTILRAVDAVDWSIGRNCDIRPRLVDKSSGVSRLIDSGSMITVTKKGPDDKLDNSVRLIAVNGSQIRTYGTKKVVVKMEKNI